MRSRKYYEKHYENEMYENGDNKVIIELLLDIRDALVSGDEQDE